jgi:hypothetical protein
MLKARMQRHRDITEAENPGYFEGFIWKAVDSFMEGKDARGFYRESRIVVE